MSTSYGAGICVGYKFLFEDALRPFEQKIGKTRFRMKKRFDPSTGKPIKPKKVYIERRQTVYVHDDLRTTDHLDDPGDEEVSTWDFLEKLAEKHGFQSVIYGYDSVDKRFVAFIPRKHPEESGDGVNDDRFEAGGDLKWSEVCGMTEELMELGKKLRSLGLEAGEPEVILTWNIS